MNLKIETIDDIIAAAEYYGILPFYYNNNDCVSLWSLSQPTLTFGKMWNLRKKAVNTHEFAYGNFFDGRMALVKKSLFPNFCALMRDGYDFDSLADEGRVSSSQITVMNAIGNKDRVKCYELSQKLNMRGFDTAVNRLQRMSYLCVSYLEPSIADTKYLATPETVFGADFVRSAYSLSNEENADIIRNALPDIDNMPVKAIEKLLKPAI